MPRRFPRAFTLRMNSLPVMKSLSDENVRRARLGTGLLGHPGMTNLSLVTPTPLIVTPAPLIVTPALFFVTPALFFVTPAKAEVQC